MRRVAAVLLLALGLAILLRPSLRALRETHRARETLLALQRGLQGHLAEKEHYPMLDRAEGPALAEFLQATGHLQQAPDPGALAAVVYTSGGAFTHFTLTVTNRSGRVVGSLDDRGSL